MASALFVLAVAMIAGGGYAAWIGYDIIVMERGWAMVIAGTVLGSAGAVLLGISAAVGRLGRLRKEMARLAPAAARVEPALERREPSMAIPPPPIRSQAAADSLLEGGPSAAPPLDPAIFQGAPEFLMRRRGGVRAPGPGVSREAAPQPAAVPPPEAERLVEERTAASNEAEENAPYAPQDPVVPDVQVQGGADPRESVFGDAPSGEPQGRPSEPPSIVGTYTSGGNRYVMYSDGTIRADTPKGEFRFESLDELKQFIANGGEQR